MSKKKDDEEIWYWYERMEEYYASGLGKKQYCASINIDYKKFCNMGYRIEYKKNSNPDEYNQLTSLANKYLKSERTLSKFCIENNINPRLLSEANNHLSYLKSIERMKKKKGSQQMNFIQVPSIQPKPPAEYKEAIAEVVENQNDIEINISKGVKVSISPNIDSMKIIKIIELLKDL